MGIFKLVFGEAPHKRMGMTRSEHDEYCKMLQFQEEAKSILKSIQISGYKSVCKVYGKEKVDVIWAQYQEVVSADGIINPVFEQQKEPEQQSNQENASLKELELKKQILEMELKLEEMKKQGR